MRGPLNVFPMPSLAAGCAARHCMRATVWRRPHCWQQEAKPVKGIEPYGWMRPPWVGTKPWKSSLVVPMPF